MKTAKRYDAIIIGARGQVDIRQGADAELVAAEQTLRLELGSLQRSLQEERGKRAALKGIRRAP